MVMDLRHHHALRLAAISEAVARHHTSVVIATKIS